MRVRDTITQIRAWLTGEPTEDRARERAERRAWASAVTLSDAGELTARWAEGTFLYHPGGYDEGPDEETAPIAPALVVLNRAGFVTTQSSPGHAPFESYDGTWFSQRASVEGLADPVTADRIETAALAAGLTVVRNGKAGLWTRRKTAVIDTVRYGSPETIADESDASFYKGAGVHLSRRSLGLSFNYGQYATPALLNAEQITIVDPEWGRGDRLWSTLTRALTTDPDTPEVTVDDPDLKVEEAHHGLSIETPVLDRGVTDVSDPVSPVKRGPEVRGWDSIVAGPIRPAGREFLAVADHTVPEPRDSHTPVLEPEFAAGPVPETELPDAPVPQALVPDSVTATVFDLDYGLALEPEISAPEPVVVCEPELSGDQPSAPLITVAGESALPLSMAPELSSLCVADDVHELPSVSAGPELTNAPEPEAAACPCDHIVVSEPVAAQPEVSIPALSPERDAITAPSRSDEDWGPPRSGYRIVNINGQLVDQPVYWADGSTITFAELDIPAGSVVVSGPELSEKKAVAPAEPEITTTPCPMDHSVTDNAESLSAPAPNDVAHQAPEIHWGVDRGVPYERDRSRAVVDRPAGETPAETWTKELRGGNHTQIHGAWTGPGGEECSVEVGKNVLGLSETGMRHEFGDPLINGVLHRNDVKEQSFRQIARYVDRNAPRVSRPITMGFER